MTGVTVNVRKAVRKLETFATRMEPETLLRAVGQRHLKWVNDNFRAEGLEQPWPSLSPNTVAGRRQGSSKILQDTGRLRQSFQMRIQGGNRVRVGSPLKIAEWHHGGTDPYIIRPRSASVLRFTTTQGTVFAKRVEHPGLPERPLIPSERTGKDLAKRVVQALVDQAARQVGR